MELTGKIVSILPEQRFNGKNGEIVKNSFVVEWQDNGYPQKLCLEVLGEDKFEKMKGNVQVGNDVLVKFSVSSREWNGKWFTSCSCFYCGAVGGQQAQQPTQQPAPQPQPTSSAVSSAADKDDSLPF